MGKPILISGYTGVEPTVLYTVLSHQPALSVSNKIYKRIF